ncbi:hypothetical protein D9757_002266 [Collybiopsis confluens]|uniref:Uncharacterized protein n=1 Tax=Collybiopsis confluens TaxID=2823264 RepID=A0A8H5HZL1_9AGAR|nr:hypothetical protein D9757_002266 [Collybiopsis confluens]
MPSRKRKRNSSSRKRRSPKSHLHNDDEENEEHIDPALSVQALEADIIRGPRGHVAALSLEIRRVGGESDIGSGLIPLGGDDYTPSAFPADQEEIEVSGNSKEDNESIWVDRYDARLLLDPDSISSMRPAIRLSAATPNSPTGWSDLPSDAEDTFFLSAEEMEDYRREKRRRVLEQAREDRLKARVHEDGEEIWGESDEEPEEPQKEIMRRTAKSLFSSLNPAHLEMRILANHGADARFAFLRGRWSRAWKTMKARARVEKLEEDKNALPSATSLGLGLVADYGPSDQSDEDVVGDTKVERNETASETPAELEAAQELRRARARRWMISRRSA